MEDDSEREPRRGATDGRVGVGCGQTRNRGQHDETRLEENRTNMTIFHFVSTSPKWSLSLFLFLASLSVPLLSPREAIQAPLRRLRLAVDNESNAYFQCTQRASKRIRVRLDDATDTEYNRTVSSHERNQHVIAESKALTESCAKAATKARAGIVRWREDGMRWWSRPSKSNDTMCWMNDVDRKR